MEGPMIREDGGGPAFAGEGDVPGDVFGGAPGGGDVGGADDAVGLGAAELGPILGVEGACGGEEEEGGEEAAHGRGSYFLLRAARAAW